MTFPPGANHVHLDDISEPAWVWDLDRARVVDANAAALDLWNEPSVADLMEREFTASDAFAQSLAQETLDATSETLTQDLVLPFPGGSRKVNCDISHHTLKDGRIGFLIIARREISADDGEDTARLAMAATNAPAALLVLDLEGQVLSENIAAQEIFGTGRRDDLATRLGSSADATALIEEALAQGRASATRNIPTRIGSRLVRLTARRGEEPSTGRPAVLVQVVDITDQRSREAELVAENAALTEFLSAGCDFYLEVDSDLRITRASGLMANRDDGLPLLGKHWRDLVSQFGFIPSNDIELALGARGGWRDLSLTLKNDSEETHYVSSARVLTSELGDFRGYRIIGREAAAPRAQAEITPLISPAAVAPVSSVPSDFADILNAAPWAVVIHRDFKPLYINVAFTELVGVPDERIEMPGEIKLLPHFPEGAKALADDYNRLMHDDLSFAVRDLTVRREDGRMVASQLRARRIEWAGEPAVEYIIEDISIQNRERRASEQRATVMSSLLDSVPEAMFLLKANGKIEWTNLAALRMLGLPDAGPAPHDLSDVLCPGDSAWARDYVAGLSEGGVTQLFAEGREVAIVDAEGTRIPALLALNRVDTGSQIKICAVLRDLSEWKRNQADMAEVRGEAAQSSTRKTEFLASISHELRTPLTAILGFAEVMSTQKLGPIGNERYLEYARDIVDSGGHLLSLINDLLDMSKVETGNLDLSFSSVDLLNLTDSCVRLMNSVASGRQINLHATLPEHLPAVVADERSLRQILLNLISNALRFTEPGGEVQVSIAADATGGLTISVADTGVGMTEEELAIALEPFEQVEKAVANGTPGTGLGLPLARALTEANRAYFRIISEPKAGTTVAITFPSTQVLA